MASTTLTEGTTLTTSKAAERLGVHPSTIRRLADAGELRALRLTPRSPRRFRVADVERLLERARGAAA